MLQGQLCVSQRVRLLHIIGSFHCCIDLCCVQPGLRVSGTQFCCCAVSIVLYRVKGGESCCDRTSCKEKVHFVRTTGLLSELAESPRMQECCCRLPGQKLLLVWRKGTRDSAAKCHVVVILLFWVVLLF